VDRVGYMTKLIINGDEVDVPPKYTPLLCGETAGGDSALLFPRAIGNF
jgi:hypothetical protein